MPPVEIIKSRSNPLVRRLLGLKKKTDAELCLVEGQKLLAEALRAGVDIVEVATAPRWESAPGSHFLLEELRARGLRIRSLADEILDSLTETETSQGVLALARRPRFDGAASGTTTGPALVVVAVGIQNPGNLGGLLRTAEAAGASMAYLSEGTADPFSWKALRGSMGSAFRLPHVRGDDPEATLRRLRNEGYRIIATVADGGSPYAQATLTGRVALVFGSEGVGLPAALLRQADQRVTIPLCPPVESLNIGVAAGILLFEAARQRQGQRA